MRTNGYNENDVVRVTRSLTGEDPFTGKPVSVSAGEIGTIVVGSPGYSEFDVEFVLAGDKGEHSAVLIVQADDLEPYRESA